MAAHAEDRQAEMEEAGPALQKAVGEGQAEEAELVVREA